MAIVGWKVIQKIPGILIPLLLPVCGLHRQVIGASSKKLVELAASDQSQRSLMAKVKLEARENKSKSERESRHRRCAEESSRAAPRAFAIWRSRRAGTPRVVSTGCSQWQTGLFPRFQSGPNKPGSKACWPASLVHPAASDPAAPVLKRLRNTTSDS